MRTKSCIGLIVLIVLCLSSAWLIGQSIGGSKSLTQSSMQALVGGAPNEGNCGGPAEGGGCGKCTHKTCNVPDQECGCTESQGVAPPVCELAIKNRYIDYNASVTDFRNCEPPGEDSCSQHGDALLCRTDWACVNEKEGGGYYIHKRCGSVMCYYTPNWYCRDCIKDTSDKGTKYCVWDWDCD